MSVKRRVAMSPGGGGGGIYGGEIFSLKQTHTLDENMPSYHHD